MSNFLHFSEHTLQEFALGFMALVYTTRLIWLLRFKAGKERQAATGRGDTSPRKGIIYSWANIAMPWSMESTRQKFFLYVQFAVFHLGVTAALGLSFIIPYTPGLLFYPGVVTIFQVTIGAACLVGLIRIVRRVSDVYMRAISTPDDYFSLIMLTVWFFFAFLAVPNKTDENITLSLLPVYKILSRKEPGVPRRVSSKAQYRDP
jgi:hypothetical protein